MPHPTIEITMASEEGLFSSKLISSEVSGKLPEGYQLRALRPSDFDTGFLECLRVLTTVGDITREAFEEQFKQMNQQGGYYIVVIEDTNRTEKEKSVVATGALIVERKLYVPISSHAAALAMEPQVNNTWRGEPIC